MALLGDHLKPSSKWAPQMWLYTILNKYAILNLLYLEIYMKTKFCVTGWSMLSQQSKGLLDPHCSELCFKLTRH